MGPTKLPAISAPTLAFFRRIVRGYFRRHFHGVRIAGEEHIPVDDGPLIIYANHSSWWDPMVSVLLGQTMFSTRKHYAPMDAEALDRYPILKRIGIFPVAMKTARGAVQFLRTGEAILRSGGVMWVTPQGQFVDGREQPLIFKPGLAALARRVAEHGGDCTVLPLAIEYPFWDERLPEALLQIGIPMRVDVKADEGVLEQQLISALAAAMEELKERSLQRNANRFTTLLGGTTGAGGFYAFGQRMKALVQRRPLPARAYGVDPRRYGRRVGEVMLFAVALTSMVCALIPAALFCANLRKYQAPPSAGTMTLPPVSVLIPARNEEASIEAAIVCILSNRGVTFEVIVMDDGSTDRTASIVKRIATEDSRVRLEAASSLPAGWNGKQHACWALVSAARYDVFCFVDADVRLEPDALARMAAFLMHREAALVSGFPRQITGTWLEWMLLPLIHFVLLGFLPLSRMRSSTDPSLAAGCGQFLMATREAYYRSGGHAEIRATMHDGLLLPRLFRQHGYRTDLADLTALARCRMYMDARQVWHGLAKNATEGIASPVRIVPVTLVLLLGQVVPFLFALWLVMRPASDVLRACVMIAVCAAWLPRLLAVPRFRQDWRGAALHPLTILLLLAVQWYALCRKMLGGAVRWKDRAYAGE